MGGRQWLIIAVKIISKLCPYTILCGNTKRKPGYVFHRFTPEVPQLCKEIEKLILLSLMLWIWFTLLNFDCPLTMKVFPVSLWLSLLLCLLLEVEYSWTKRQECHNNGKPIRQWCVNKRSRVIKQTRLGCRHSQFHCNWSGIVVGGKTHHEFHIICLWLCCFTDIILSLCFDSRTKL